MYLYFIFRPKLLRETSCGKTKHLGSQFKFTENRTRSCARHFVFATLVFLATNSFLDNLFKNKLRLLDV